MQTNWMNWANKKTKGLQRIVCMMALIFASAIFRLSAQNTICWGLYQDFSYNSGSNYYALSGAGNPNAISLENLNFTEAGGELFAEFTTTELLSSSNYEVGFNVSNSYATDSVIYGVRVQGTTIKAIKNGVITSLTSITQGDVIKVSLSANRLKIYKNADIKHNDSTLSVSGDFYLHMLSHTTTGTTKIGSLSSSYHEDARKVDMFNSQDIDYNVEDNIITATSYPGNFSTYNYLPASSIGWMQISLGSKVEYGYRIGFADVTDGSLKYYIDITDEQTFELYNLYEDDAPVLTENYNPDDILSIEIGNNVVFRLNGTVVLEDNLQANTEFNIAGSLYNDAYSPTIHGLVTNIPNTSSPIAWSSLELMDFVDLNSLLKRNASGTGTDNGIAYSLGSLEEYENGYIDFKIAGESTTASMVGLVDEKYATATDMDYYFSFYKSGANNTVAGFYKTTQLFTTTYNPTTDRFKLDKQNGEIRFIKNNSILHTRTIDDAFAEFYTQVFIRNSAHNAKDLKIIKWVGKSLDAENWDDAVCEGNDNTHWVENRSFDYNGNLIGRDKVFTDYLGRTLQAQSRVFSDNNTLAYQPLNDDLGRPVASTLAAPTYKDYFCYDPLFVSNTSSTQYTYTDFDKPITNSNLSGERNNPKDLQQTTQGQLGWYYSSNNTEEAFVADDKLPYARNEYYPDPLARVKRSGGVGNPLKMGSGKESRIFYLASAGELKYVHNADIKQHKKTVTLDEEGKVYISYTNGMGQILATCRSGITHACTNQKVTSVILPGKQNFVDIHLPYATRTSFYLPVANNLYDDAYGAGVYTSAELNTIATIYNGGTSISCGSSDPDVIFTILNLDTYAPLVEGTDYSVSSTTGAVTFLGTYASSTKPFFLRIKAAYTPCYLAKIYWHKLRRNGREALANLAIKYELDYSQWAINYYDKANQLVKTIQPEGIDCIYDPNISTVFTAAPQQTFATTSPSNVTATNGTPSYIATWYSSNASAPTNHFNVTYMNENSGGTNHFDAPTGYGTTPFTQRVNLYLLALPNPSMINNYNTSSVANPCDLYDYNVNGPTYVDGDDWVKNRGLAPDEKLLIGGGENPGQDLDGLILLGKEMMDQDEKSLTGSSFEDQLMSYVLQEATGGGPSTNYIFPTDGVQGDGDPILPTDPCAGKAPQDLVRFRIYADLQAESGGTTVTFPFTSEYLEVHFNITCACQTKWVNDNLVHAQLEIDENGMVTHSNGTVAYSSLTNFRIHITSVKASVNEGVSYENFTPDDFTPPVMHNEFLHDWYRFFYLKTEIAHFKYPLNNTQEHEMAEIYKYDNEGQLIESWTPDEGKTLYKYDNEGKIRFTQNKLQSNASTSSSNQYSYVNYDRAGRPTQTGVYTGTTAFGSISGTQLEYTTAFPTTGLTETSKFYYDTKPTAYPFGYPSAYTQSSINLMGKVTLMENDNASTWFNYNNYGQVTQVVTQFSPLTSTISAASFKTLDYEYDITKGQLIKTKMQNGITNEEFYHQYSYDADGRLKEVRANTTNNFTSTSTIVENYYYYDHGALKRVEKGGTSILQGLDYVYTIQGWLKSLNDPTLTVRDPGRDGYAPQSGGYADIGYQNITGTNSGFEKDVFGFAIDYFTDDYRRKKTYIEPNNVTGTDAKDYYDGKIKGVRWNMRTSTLAASHPYYTEAQVTNTYLYDDFNRLSQSRWGAVSTNGTINNTTGSGGSSLTITYNANNDYKESGITYDRNGNILTLIRNRQTATGNTMDNLTYSYKKQDNPYTAATNLEKTNMLHKAVDGVNGAPATDDISDGQANDNYTYDVLGRMIQNTDDQYKITYNASGYITEVRDLSNVLLVKYGYDAGGKRIWKETYGTGGSLTGTTYYHRDIGGQVVGTYKYASSTLSPFDITIYGAGRIGLLDVEGTTSTKRTNYLDNIHYELTDHLGNIRAVFKRGTGNTVVLESVADYYAFGAPMPGRNIQSTTPLYQFTTQGQQTDPELSNRGMVEFELRFLETRLGRWMSPDPYNQYWSPYTSMGNNPVSRIDPDGGADIASAPEGVNMGFLGQIGSSDEALFDLHSWASDNVWSDGNNAGVIYYREKGKPEPAIVYTQKINDGALMLGNQQDICTSNSNGYDEDGNNIKPGPYDPFTPLWVWIFNKYVYQAISNSNNTSFYNLEELAHWGTRKYYNGILGAVGQSLVADRVESAVDNILNTGKWAPGEKLQVKTQVFNATVNNEDLVDVSVTIRNGWFMSQGVGRKPRSSHFVLNEIGANDPVSGGPILITLAEEGLNHLIFEVKTVNSYAYNTSTAFRVFDKGTSQVITGLKANPGAKGFLVLPTEFYNKFKNDPSIMLVLENFKLAGGYLILTDQLYDHATLRLKLLTNYIRRLTNFPLTKI
jgi:RHS repeat-associated protein